MPKPANTQPPDPPPRPKAARLLKQLGLLGDKPVDYAKIFVEIRNGKHRFVDLRGEPLDQTEVMRRANREFMVPAMQSVASIVRQQKNLFSGEVH